MPSSRGLDVLDGAFTALGQVRDALAGTDDRLARGRLGLLSGWLQADASIVVVWGQAKATTAESEKEAASAKAAREAALTDAASVARRCDEAETRLKVLQEEKSALAERLRQQGEALKTCEAQLADRAAELSAWARGRGKSLRRKPGLTPGRRLLSRLRRKRPRSSAPFPPSSSGFAKRFTPSTRMGLRSP